MDEEIVAVIVVGAGPIGIECAANLSAAGLSCLVLEAGVLGNTIAGWPATTPFFSSPERCAIAGVPIQSLHQSMLTGEEYLAYLRGVVEVRDLNLRLHSPVVSIRKDSSGFELIAGRAGLEKRYRCRHLVLATGNMNRPRTLGVPGENLAHVTHRFTGVHRYFRQKLLIVGGRNSAVEAAIRCFRAGADVTISYRRAAFEEKKLNSRYFLEISILTSKNKIGFLPETQIQEIRPDRVVLSSPNGPIEKRFDFVLIQAGYEADLRLMEMAGVEFEGEEQIPVLNKETMETNVEGLFLAGTASGGGRAAYKLFVATSHNHGWAITKRITGKEGMYRGSIASRYYPFDNDDIAPTEGNSEEASQSAIPFTPNVAPGSKTP